MIFSRDIDTESIYDNVFVSCFEISRFNSQMLIIVLKALLVDCTIETSIVLAFVSFLNLSFDYLFRRLSFTLFSLVTI